MKERVILDQLGEAGDETKVWNCFDYEHDGIIEASAGTGKTYTLQSIVLKLLVEKRVESVTNLLLVTFTEKAAGELKNRIREILEKAEMLPSDFDEMTICTIHAFCRELLSEYAFENGVPMAMEIGGSDADLVHRAVRTTLLGKKFREAYGEVFRDKAKFNQIVSVDELVEKAKGVMRNGAKADLPKDEESQAIVKDLAEWSKDEFERLKDEAFLLTYDDLIAKASEVIEREAAREAEGEESALLASIRRRYRIALVDEFQDTDAKQWNIFKSIFSSRVNKLEGEDVPRPKQGFLLVVGDPKQAIYSFRGADIATYLKARTEICEGQKKQTLSFTYRSSKELVGAFNVFFGKTGWFKGMSAGDGIGTIEYEDVGYPEGNKRFKDYKNKTGRGVVTLLEAMPQKIEVLGTKNSGYGNAKMCVPVFARNAAREMKHLYSLPEGMGRRIEYKDMCVLVRKQADAQVVREVLAAEGVPCTYYKESGVFSAEEAEMLIALFDFLGAPSQHGRLAALLLTPLFNVPLSQLNAKLFKMPEQLMRLLDRWQEYCKTRRWGLLFESVMSDTCLAHPRAGDFYFDRRWTAARQILDALLQKVAPTALTIADFALVLRSWREKDRAGEGGEENAALRQIESESSSVQIMTMHTSKGLEFKAVFLASGFASSLRDEDKDEFKRLFYVAVTRAEYLLYLPWSQWATHERTKKDATMVSGIGSVGAPLFDGGFLAEGICAYFRSLGQNPDEKVVAWDADKSAAGESGITENAPAKTAAEKALQIYEIGNVRNRRLHYDSFTSMKGHYSAYAVQPDQASVQDEDEGMAVEAESEEPPRTTLLPRTSFSGTVFHKIMETLCLGDESEGLTGFAIGREPREKALAADGKLLKIVHSAMEQNALKNRTSPEGDSTEQTLARMVYNALNTPITIGARQFFLKDISFSNRLAEVDFAMDEAKTLGKEFSPHREGVFNGAIDLVVRPDGPGGPIYFIDWKTNFLSSYSSAAIAKAIKETLYPLQYQLYTLAAARWLGGEKLAGLAYLFVRGGEFDDSPSGVYSHSITPEFLDECIDTITKAL